MIEHRIPVGVIADRRVIDNPWVDHVWEPVAALPGVPETPAWTELEIGPGYVRYYIGHAELLLTSSETANYRNNLIEGRPRLWIVVREEGPEPPLTLAAVTADPMEGEAHTESGASIVAAVPMPPEIAAIVAAFVDEHHVERQFVKRRRDRISAEDVSRRDFTRRNREGGP